MKNSNNHLSSSLQTNNHYLIEITYFNQFSLTINIDELTVLEDDLKDNDLTKIGNTYLLNTIGLYLFTIILYLFTMRTSWVVGWK